MAGRRGKYPLLERNKVSVAPIKIEGASNSLNFKSEYPYDKVTPFLLVCYIQFLHKKNGSELKRPREALLKEASSFYEDYGPDKAVELIDRASTHCKFFGFDYLRELAKNENISRACWRPSKAVRLF